MPYSLKNNEQGLTIVELVFGLAISLILMGIAIKIFLAQQRSYNVQEQLSEMQQNIRAAMDMIVRETKMAGYNPFGITNFYGIPYASDTLTILADIDGDGTTTSTNEEITYKYYDDPDFQIKRKGKASGASFQPLTDNIQECTFSYLDANGIGTTTPEDIRQIRVTITGRTDKADPDLERIDGSGYRYGTLTTFVTPLNLGF